MKLQDDMHNSIEGYGTPKLDIEGYFGVDIGQEYGTGVCRNMADDIVCKLNAINPDYNARMFIVKSTSGDSETPDIYTRVTNTVVTDGTRFDNTQIRNTISLINYLTENDDILDVLGNHAVVAVDLKKENITLIIDPTNTCLGVFKDGNITILNSSDKEQPFTMYRTPLDDVAYRGLESLEVPLEYTKSFLNPFISINELNEKYGIEAQQEALESAKMKEENYIYQCSKQNEFKNSLHVTIEDSNTHIYSTDELEKLYSECMEKVFSINNPEQVIELANISRNIDYNIEYYNQKQEELVGKNINYYSMISQRLNLDMSTLRENIAKKMIETNAVVFPENDDINEFLCIAYLQAGNQERMQNLKFTFDEKENNYYILNNNTLLATVNVRFDEEGQFSGVSYNSNDIKTDSELEILLKNSSPILNSNTQIKDIETEDDIDISNEK